MPGRHTIESELLHIPLFAGLSRREVAWVPRLSTPVELPAGHVLAREGDRGAEFFIVIDGHVEVLQDRRLVATRGPGSPLGEIALLDDRPRTASLVAQSPIRARVSSRQEFNGLLAEVPDVSQRLHATMAQRLAS
jgi:CRP/FNR family cyclic AMP-dependent transcriptional regulator